MFETNASPNAEYKIDEMSENTQESDLDSQKADITEKVDETSTKKSTNLAEDSLISSENSENDHQDQKKSSISVVDSEHDQTSTVNDDLSYSDEKNQTDESEDSPQKDETKSSEDSIEKQKEDDRLNFDWNKHIGGIKSIGDTELKEFEEQVDDNFIESLDNKIIKGTIVRIADREAIVDISSKSEGVISLNEFRYNPSLKEGDRVDVIVDKAEDQTGQLVLSHRKARTIKTWEKVNEAFKEDKVLTGQIKCRTKGGMIVDIDGIEAFLPGSQIDIKPVKDYDEYLNRRMEFKIVKINQEFKNIVVSHKVLVEADMEELKREIIENLKKGNVLNGKVKSIMSYGVFVELGAIDGLIHIGDLSWKRISHPSEVVEQDQLLDVVVLDFDKDSLKIQLGLKQLEEHPWDKLSPEVKDGSVLKAKILTIHDFGVHVEVENGVEGFMKVYDMSWSTYLRSASEFVAVGDQVDVAVVSIDRDARKLYLGMKQLTKDPWTDITEKYQVGTMHTGVVRHFTDFGVFVEMEPGIDGLLYISDLSWTKRIKHPTEVLSIGDEIEVKIMDLDTKERRLRLGHKQTKENPWDKYQDQYAVGTVHKFKINKVINGDGVIHFQDGLLIYVNKRGMIKQDGKSLTKGEEAEFKIIEFNKNTAKVMASHTSVHRDQERENAKIAQRGVSKRDIKKTTFAELEGDPLSGLKDKLRQDEQSKDKPVTRRTKDPKEIKPFVLESAEEELDAKKPEHEENSSGNEES